MVIYIRHWSKVKNSVFHWNNMSDIFILRKNISERTVSKLYFAPNVLSAKWVYLNKTLTIYVNEYVLNWKRPTSTNPIEKQSIFQKKEYFT